MGESGPTTTVVYVVFGNDHLDLSQVPPQHPVVVVHNDDSLRAEAVVGRRRGAAEVIHVRGHGNVGFAAGANLGLERVATQRVIFCNPDTRLSRRHWEALSCGGEDDVVSIPMVDRAGRPASVLNAYPTPLSLVLTAHRASRIAPRGSLSRRALQRFLGRWGSSHAASAAPGVRALREAWCSGALFSVDTERMRAIGGFDPGYFLYFEDVDACARLAAAFPGMRASVVESEPALHEVGGSAQSAATQRMVERHLVASALRYSTRPGGDTLRWRAARQILALRLACLARG